MNRSEREYSRASEERLVGYLEELREDPPRSETALVEAIARRARWQRAIRAPLQVAGGLAAALVDGLAALLGVRGRPDR